MKTLCPTCKDGYRANYCETCNNEGYIFKPEGIFSNGDLWFGHRHTENGREWFGAIRPNHEPAEGPDYETEETPDTFVLFTIARFNEGTPEAFVKDHLKEYELAKNTGDQRFGIKCEHARAKRGYCPDCLRKVI